MTSPTAPPAAPVSTDLRNRIRKTIVQIVASSRGCEPSEVETNPKIADDLEEDSLALISVYIVLGKATGVQIHPMDELNLFFWTEHRSGLPFREIENDLITLFTELALPIPQFAQVKSTRDFLTVDVLTGLVVKNMRNNEVEADLRKAEHERFQKRWGAFATVVGELLAIAELFALVWSAIKRCWKR